ncbi:DciA family protein [Streptomyces sp. NPDC090499]|uniref:DciA family protein n=1 Tax=Streptomyces sp. NPDC090499 TaxID=3365965 RepID=UPI0038158AE9
MTQPTSGVDLARAALAAARAAAKNRPAQPQQKQRTTTPRTSSRHRLGDPMGLGTAIGRMMTEHGWQPPEQGGSILDQWPTIAPELADKVAVVRFEHDTGILHLRPASPAYATQLRLHHQQILGRIQQTAAGRSVRALKILAAGTTARPADPTPAAPSGRDAEDAPVKTRETAAPGYRATLEAALTHRPEPATADPYLAAAIRRQEAALRANRQPEDEHRDAVWEAGRLAAQQANSAEVTRRAAIARARHERATGPAPRRTPDVA